MMAQFRVLQVFTIMNRGGAESMIMNYYRQLNKKFIQFDFIVHRKEKGIFDEEIEALGGKIYRFNPINPFFPDGYYNELKGFLKSHDYQYKIIHSHLNTFSCFPLKIAEELNIPYRIAHAHIAMEKPTISRLFSGANEAKEYLKSLVKLVIKKKVTKHATHFFSCGVKAGDWLFGPDIKFNLMNNAINAKNFKFNQRISLEYRETLKLGDNRVFGHIGRFNTQKNHIFLIDVFAELIKLKPLSKLLLVGDGPLRGEIEKYVETNGLSEKVCFLGVRTDIPNLCMVMDYFIFPSFYEGLPVTLIEAQCSGLKILASDRITKEVKITENITFESLDTPPLNWAKKIISQIDYVRNDAFSEIVANQYDIVENTINLEQFYSELNNDQVNRSMA